MLQALPGSAQRYLSASFGHFLGAPEGTCQRVSGTRLERPQVLIRVLRALPRSARRNWSECFGRSLGAPEGTGQKA